MVKHTVRWSEQSKIDLKEIFEYIKNVEEPTVHSEKNVFLQLQPWLQQRRLQFEN